MANNQGTDRALTWADKFIKDLLTESEKYQDVIKDLSTDAIRDTVRKLGVTSDEFRTGADIIGERVYGYLYQASDEVRNYAYDELFPIITTLAPPPSGVDDELLERLFDIERELANARNEAEDEATEQEEYRAFLQQDISHLATYWTDQATEGIKDLLIPMTSIITEGIVTMIPAAISALFSNFMDAFFEDV